MDNIQMTISRRALRTGVGVMAALLLFGGVAWRGLAQTKQALPHGGVTQSAPIGRTVPGARDSYADIVAAVAPGVVTIRTEARSKVSPTQFQNPDNDFFGQFFGGSPFGRGQRPQTAPRTFRKQALGSGVMVTADGYILTNNHVIDGADQIKVEFPDGRTLDAKVVGADKPTDLAVLAVHGTDFDTVALGNSDDVKVGDVVLAVGNPMGLGETVTMGIISAKGRSTGTGDGSYEDFLQTDAPINHGNSGGALVNTKGQLVGINSQILSNSDGNIGIGFAIPVNMAKTVMAQLRTNGKVTRAQLGVAIQNISSDMAANLGLKRPGGVIVSSVSTGGAADRAGVKQGDVITEFNGQQVRDSNALRNRVAQSAPGSTADLTVTREGTERHLSIKLDELKPDTMARNGRNGESADGAAQGQLGVSVEPLTPELAGRLGVKGGHGLVVDQVNPDGRAADAGIQPGDVIESVNRRAVSSVDDVRTALSADPDRPALLLVNRSGKEIYVTVRPAKG
jgi:Do/DeqQ family serine protease